MEGGGMLVLSRKLGEQVLIGNRVEVTVLEVRGNRVKLGLSGPATTPIHRREVYEAVCGTPPPALGCAECA